MKIEIRKAARTASRVRIGLAGPSGSGKTYSALRIGHALAAASEPTNKPGSRRVLVIDTERESADLYAGESTVDGVMDFDVIPLPDFKPETFTAALKAGAAAGYSVIVIDSFTHAWQAILAWKDGMQGNSFTNWGKVTPVWDALIDTMLRSPAHIICCLRSKQEHAQVKDERTGRQEVQKLGMGAIVRDGMEYEFTVFADMEHGSNRLIVSKTRCSALSGTTWIRPGADFAAPLLTWLSSAEAAAAVAAPAPEAPAERATKPRETPEQAEARKAAHHPSFTDAEKKAFGAACGALDLPGKHGLDEVSAFAEWTGAPRPSGMPPERRAGLIKFLGTDEGRDKWVSWMERS